MFTRTPHVRATPIEIEIDIEIGKLPEIDFDHDFDFDTELLRVENKNALAMLQLLLLQRFGNMLDQDVQERLQNARPEQLETWARRILDARSIDEVFAEDGE